MKLKDENSFILDNFEGPLDFLLLLIQKEEIDICNILLRQIIHQYFSKGENEDVDTGGDFVASISHLVLLKSRSLLPQHDQAEEEFILEEEDPQFQMIHHLIDYCRFKDAAKLLSEKENLQSEFYARGIDTIPEVKKKLGVEHLSLNDFAELFQHLLIKANSQKKIVQEEPWKVADKILSIRKTLQNQNIVPLMEIFSIECSRLELIVTFLAVLELLKLGEVSMIRKNDTGIVALARKE